MFGGRGVIQPRTLFKLCCVRQLPQNPFRPVFVQTYLADTLAVCQVVGDDFSQLWEVPAVPLSAAHDVVVQFFIQVIQQS